MPTEQAPPGMQRVVLSSALLLAGMAWLPAAEADIYVGHDASGVLVLSDTPFEGAQQIYRTPGPATLARVAEPSPASWSGAPTGPPASSPDSSPAPGKSFLRED